VLKRWENNQRALIAQEPKLEQIVRLLWMSLPPAERLTTPFSTHALPGKWTEYRFANVLPGDLYLSAADRQAFIDEPARDALYADASPSARTFVGWIANGEWSEHRAFLAQEPALRVGDIAKMTSYQRWRAGLMRIHTAEDFEDMKKAWVVLGRPHRTQFYETLARDLAPVDASPGWIDSLSALLAEPDAAAMADLLVRPLLGCPGSYALLPALVRGGEERLGQKADELANGLEFDSLVQLHWTELCTWLAQNPKRFRQLRARLWSFLLAGGGESRLAEGMRALNPDLETLMSGLQWLAEYRPREERTAYVSELTSSLIFQPAVQSRHAERLLETFEVGPVLQSLCSRRPSTPAAQKNAVQVVKAALGKELPAAALPAIALLLGDLLANGMDGEAAELCGIAVNSGKDGICRRLVESGCISPKTPKTFRALYAIRELWTMPLVRQAVLQIAQLKFKDEKWVDPLGRLFQGNPGLTGFEDVAPATRLRIRLRLMIDGAWTLTIARHQQELILQELHTVGAETAMHLAEEVDFVKLEQRWLVFSGELAGAIALLANGKIPRELLLAGSSVRAALRSADWSEAGRILAKPTFDKVPPAVGHQDWVAVLLRAYRPRIASKPLR
jgi:hypothetical protein